MTSCVNALACTTGTPEVPPAKLTRGYRHVKDKFDVANLTPESSELVSSPRVRECPVQMEARLLNEHKILSGSPEGVKGSLLAVEVQILRTYVLDELRLRENKIDPDAWRPMIMSFQHLYGLQDGKLAESKLAHVEEELYRLPGADK